MYIKRSQQKNNVCSTCDKTGYPKQKTRGAIHILFRHAQNYIPISTEMFI